MSTYWGYACTSHDPHLVSDRWFNHGEDVLADAFVKERAGEWPDREVIVGVNDFLGPDPEPVVLRSHETTEPIWWLRQHPHCEVVLRDEYGNTRPLGETVVGGRSLSRREN